MTHKNVFEEIDKMRNSITFASVQPTHINNKNVAENDTAASSGVDGVDIPQNDEKSAERLTEAASGLPVKSMDMNTGTGDETATSTETDQPDPDGFVWPDIRSVSIGVHAPGEIKGNMDAVLVDTEIHQGFAELNGEEKMNHLEYYYGKDCAVFGVVRDGNTVVLVRFWVSIENLRYLIVLPAGVAEAEIGYTNRVSAYEGMIIDNLNLSPFDYAADAIELAYRLSGDLLDTIDLDT